MKLIKKRVSESEFAEALANCTKTAKKAYRQTIKHFQELESIISKLNLSLTENAKNLLNKKDAKNFSFSKALNKVIDHIQEISENGLKDLKDAIDVKSKYLNDFTITLFGRTKAGKSTIRESLTKNGDGGTIGIGRLHTTKEARDYKWKGLRILDTPGVEGYKGEKETQKAIEVIDQTDIVIFLTTDESQQHGEFEEMKRLIEINKPFFVILNVKDKLTDPHYLERFLKKKANLFNTEVIQEHKKRILKETEKIGIHNVIIIPISALASCISQFAERGFSAQNKEEFLNSLKHPQIKSIVEWFLNKLNRRETRKLWELSQIEEVFNQIAFEVNTHGKQRRVLTFFDSTINFIDTISKMLEREQFSIRAQAEFMVEKKKELQKFFDRFIKENDKKIDRECRRLFSKIKEWIPDFVDEYLGEDNAKYILKQRLNREKERIRERMKNLFYEIDEELKKELSEFSSQFEYDTSKIKIELPEIGSLKKNQTSKILKWVGVGSGVLSTIAFVLSWNPVVLILGTGGGIITEFLKKIFRKKEEIKWLKAKRNAKNDLLKRIDKIENNTLSSIKSDFSKEFDKIVHKTNHKVSIYINKLFSISNNLKQYIQQLKVLQNQINKELFTQLLQLSGVDCSEKNLLSIAREQGIATKIMVTDKIRIADKTKVKLEKLCNENILIFSDTGDIRDRIIKALQPAKPALDQIKITHDNGQVIAKIKISGKEKDIYTGKDGINLRLAQQVSTVKIELI
jgi:small GTP-binding protein